VNADDEGWVWTGSYWVDREQRDAHPRTFADEAAAQAYAEEVFRE
jgi:hypothetical protein